MSPVKEKLTWLSRVKIKTECFNLFLDWSLVSYDIGIYEAVIVSSDWDKLVAFFEEWGEFLFRWE